MARTREFQIDEATAKIKDVFWRLGYEGASMAQIETATGVKKQSLYRVFGDKRGMYLAALKDYDRVEIAAAKALLKSTESGVEGIRTLFAAVIDHVAVSDDRRGCLLCNASVDQAVLDGDTGKVVVSIMDDFQRVIERCFNRDWPELTAAELEAKALAVLSAYFGLRVLIKAGKSVSQLQLASDNLLPPLLQPA